MLTDSQRGYVTAALESDLPSKCIDYFLKNYPCLRDVLEPEEMQALSWFACASAARTYDPGRAGISAYFSRAILHELLKGCRKELKHGSRSLYRISLRAIESRRPVERQEGDPMQAVLAALPSLLPTDRRWVEQHIIGGQSVRQMAKTERLSTRQVARILRERLQILVRATEDQPSCLVDLDTSR